MSRGTSEASRCSRSILLAVLAALATAAGAGLGPLLAVDANQPAARDRLVQLGVPVYASSEHWFLVQGSGSTQDRLDQEGLRFLVVVLGSDLPGHLVYEQEGRVLNEPEAAAVLFRQGNVALVQMDDIAAVKAAQLGAELVRLPDRPYRLHPFRACGFPRVAEPDTFVQRLVGMVSADSIRARMQRLEDFQTRFSYTDSCRAAEQWVHDYFVGLGLDSVEFHTYQHGGQTWRNVVGTRLGLVNPEKSFIICGHMDAISEDPYNLAPGAEDNASGTAMALEAARIMAGEQFDQTVRFVTFTGEEQGLIGSQHYARDMRAQGTDILGVINFDMVAWPGGDWGISLVGLHQAQRLVQLQVRMKELYTDLDHRVQVRSFPSDSRSFEEQGYVATSGFEYGHIPYPGYHSTGDTLGNLSMELAAEVAKMCVATLATMAVAPVPPEGFELLDVGNGMSLVARWLPNTEPDLEGYRLLWGTDSFSYTDSVTLGLVEMYRIDGLSAGTRYYSAVVAFDSLGHESGPSEEASAVPSDVPLAPIGIEAWPDWSGMVLSWHPSPELDVIGYNLYRSTTSGVGYGLLNAVPFADTVYADSGLAADTMYYYVATAVDSNQNESEYSEEVRGKPTSLDHGILLVDETRDGNGTPGSPSDVQQDEFYHMLLRGFRYRDWDVAEQGVPMAGDIGPFSTLVWHGDEYQQQEINPAVPGLAHYLGFGGRLWIVGWKPVAGIMGIGGGYPYDFVAGDFPHDWLHLARAEQSPIADFTGATGQSGYPDLELDSSKMLGALHGKLPYVDAVLPRDAEAILTFNSAAGDTFDGKPVGVRWLNGPHRAAVFGFPLYYAKDEDARALTVRLLEDLGEPYGITERGLVVADRLLLEPVRPNPTSGRAAIRYSVPQAGRVRLGVFDATGRLVRELVSQQQTRGWHQVVWSGCGASGRKLGAGIYFCRLTIGGDSAVCRLELLR